ncbi:hypothetical protein D9M68_138840 [compost metagenome]
MSEWIKCSERLPVDRRDVQVYCADTKEQMVAFHIGHGRFQFAQDRYGDPIACRPTHWRHLPEPPR